MSPGGRFGDGDDMGLKLELKLVKFRELVNIRLSGRGADGGGRDREERLIFVEFVGFWELCVVEIRVKLVYNGIDGVYS